MKTIENLKPKFLQYTIYTIGSKIMCRKLKIKVNRTGLINFLKNRENKKNGYIIIYNHSCDIDHFAMCSTLNHRRANNVLAKYFYFNKKLSPLLDSVKCIYKDQFVADLGAIRLMKRAVMRPGIISIAPAGQMSGDGGEQYISRTIVKLIRFIHCDVIALTLNGGHFKKPKWATKENKRKKFKLNSYVSEVMKESEIDSLNDQEIYERICEYSNYNCYDYQKEHMDYIDGEHLAEGLENLLFICPKCGKMHNHSTSGSEMRCNNCGNTIIYNHYGFLEGKTKSDISFEDEHKWNIWQRDLLKEKLRNHSLEELVIPVDMERNYRIENKLERCGEGFIHLGDGFLYYEGTFNGEQYHKDFKYDSLFLVPHGLGKSFFCPDTEGSFKFFPKENFSVVNEVVLRIDAKRELDLENGRDI